MSANPFIPFRRIIYGTSLKANEGAVPTTIVTDATIASWLSEPTWSVRSMLPDKYTQLQAVSKTELHHLLRLSALKPPETKEKEAKMIKTLQTQLHFVKQVQDVDTSHLQPLVTIRDETVQHIDEQTVTLETLSPFLAKEEHVGTNGTVRRRKSTEKVKDSGWNPFALGLGSESRMKGRYFFVNKTQTADEVSTPRIASLAPWKDDISQQSGAKEPPVGISMADAEVSPSQEGSVQPATVFSALKMGLREERKSASKENTSEADIDEFELPAPITPSSQKHGV